jgi:hypothetical protein
MAAAAVVGTLQGLEVHPSSAVTAALLEPQPELPALNQAAAAVRRPELLALAEMAA